MVNSVQWVGKIVLASGWLLTTLPASAISLSEAFGDSRANTEAASPAIGIGGLRVEGAKPLPVAQAFNVTLSQQEARLTVQAQVKDGYYVYRDKFKLTLPEGVTAAPLTFSAQPSFVDDPDFGHVAVFDHDVTVSTTLKSVKSLANTPNDNTLILKWQGCAKAGLCYPPQTLTLALADLPVKTEPSSPTITASTPTTATNAAQVTKHTEPAVSDNPANATQTAHTASTQFTAQADMLTASVPVTQTALATDLAASAVTNDHGASLNSNRLTPSTSVNATHASTDRPINDPFGLHQHTALAFLLLFLAGLGLAFTPCVLPMLPIVANIVAQTSNKNEGSKTSRRRGLLLTASYALGMATSYGMLGALVAVFGQSLGLVNRLQQPPVLLAFAALFVVLAFYMLDKLPLRLPTGVAARIQRLGQVGHTRLGNVGGSLLAGFFSALVVSPCVSAPLAGALAGVAATGNAMLGFGALFMLGLGLSTPLMLLGATQGALMQRLPKAGAWMHWVKTGFAWLLLAVALLLVERVWQSSLMLVWWALWWAVLALGAWHMPEHLRIDTQTVEKHLGRKLLWRAPALVTLAWVGCLVVGAALGSQNSLQPLDRLLPTANPLTPSANPSIPAPITITDVDALPNLLAQHPNVLVDVTADWCIECRLMERELFATPPSTFAGWQRVRLDVTADTPKSRAVYQTLDIFAPPVLLYYQNGKLVLKQQGAVSRSQFEQTLSQFN